jgi:glycosyltransferase involved in cell wall biosynthesis
MSKRLLFIGAINENHPPKGGEEYKNQLILNKLKRETIQLSYIDTISWKKSPLLVLKLFWNILFISYDSIVISASSVSTYRLLKIIRLLRPKLLSKITYLVIGGYFPEGIISGNFTVAVYKNLHAIIVEGNSIKSKLDNFLNRERIHVAPNFKEFPALNFISNHQSKTFEFVFVGRITESKGVKLILDAAREIQNKHPEFDFKVSFFGPQEEIFEFQENCEYHGFLDFQEKSEESYSQLSSYDCFLFPTSWIGEGFPGVIIDAYVAGLPVIASDWNMNSEIIKHELNGLLIPVNDLKALVNQMIYAMNNPLKMKEMGNHNRKHVEDFHIDSVWPNLLAIIK